MKELKDKTKHNLVLDSNANMRLVLDEDAMCKHEFVQKNKPKLLHAVSILLTIYGRYILSKVLCLVSYYHNLVYYPKLYLVQKMIQRIKQ